MVDFASLYDEHKDLSADAQKKAGQADAGSMGDEHTNFVKTISSMIKSGEINVFQPDTFLKKSAYDALSERDRSVIDLSLINVADLLRIIADFYMSKQTPDASPQLEQMIEHLWQMKERLEKKYGDILKF